MSHDTPATADPTEGKRSSEATNRSVYAGSVGWMNMGYSEAASPFSLPYPEVASGLAARVAEAAGLGPGQQVVDVGCGHGVQDLMFLEQTPGIDITAYNISPEQIDSARQSLASSPFADRGCLRFEVADAVALPAADASCDRVLSIESAFHYDTRSDFFGEAHRILRPGGLLVMADIIGGVNPRRLSHAWWQRFPFPLVRAVVAPFQKGDKATHTPVANLMGLPAYESELERAGFASVEIVDISDRIVMWPNLRLARELPRVAMLPKPWVHRYHQLAYNVDIISRRDFQYVLVVAEKPAAGA